MRTTWVEDAAGSLFDVDNLPMGIVDDEDEPRAVARIGEFAVDLAPLAATTYDAHAVLLEGPTLNPFLAAGPRVWPQVREWLQDLLVDPAAESTVAPYLLPLDQVRMRLPVEVADYVDFYASEHHAANVGRILRPDAAEPLLPNWKHLPVGYHGRSGTVVVSGTDVRRPNGQRKPPDPGTMGTGGTPEFGPSLRLDLEAELGFVVGVPTALGQQVDTAGFATHVFGVVGLNDWSARDVQAWEYVPLGPFLGKSFATSVSAWVTPMAALEAARVDLPAQHPEPLPYLAVDQPAGLDIAVEVELGGEVVARPAYASMYWSPAQMLAHLTVNGASLRTGDLFASGTISGPTRTERGCLLELCWGGQEPYVVAGRPRTFLEDGDEVVLRYTAPGVLGGRIALGEVRGRVLPALTPGPG